VSAPAGPVPPEERRAAVAAWRALPQAVRRQVVTASRSGEALPPGLTSAAEAGRRYAVVTLAPRGPHWWQRHRWDAEWTPLLVGLAALLVVGAWWVHSTGVAWRDLWGALLLALVLLLFAAVNRGLRRTLLALAARPLSGAPPPSG
jgi:hypothetical protein